MFPFPIGPLSGLQEFLTKIDFEFKKTVYQPGEGGIEDEIDGDGGVNIQTINFSNVNFDGTGTATVDLTSNKILWKNKYNYRIGSANMYYIKNIKLYKDGILAETQSPSTFINIITPISAMNNTHAGINLNPSLRTLTAAGTDAGVGYPK